MVERCIMIFPEFENGCIIDELRDRYDPLANYVKPHITLVFPFESEISKKELENHIKATLSGIGSFRLILQGIVAARTSGNYLFLQVSLGDDEIKKIHDRLYTSILTDYLKVELPYTPHLTIGKLPDVASFMVAFEATKSITDKFETIVSRISVEVIDTNLDSIIEFEYELPN